MIEVTRCVVRSFSSPYGAIHIRYSSEILQEESHTGAGDPNFWKPALQDFLTDSLTEPVSRAKLLKAKSGQAKVAFLSAPLFDPSGPAIGAMAVVVPVSRENDWMAGLATLESLCQLASFCVEFLGRQDAARSAAGAPDRAWTRAAHCESHVELAYALVNELRNKLGCEQVALGWVKGHHVRAFAVSGLDHVNRRTPGIISLQAAMEECLDAGCPIVFQRAGEWVDPQLASQHFLHKQWHASANGDAVASLPLRVQESVVAILSVRSRADRPFNREQIEDIRRRIEPFAPALVLTHRAGRNLARHGVDAAASAVRSLTRPGTYGKKAAVAMTALSASWFCFGSMDYTVTVPCTIGPAQMRHVAAPFGGVLASAEVLQGDEVQVGDVLCELDHRDLDQQLRELTAQAEVYQREEDRARAADSPAEASVARANQKLAQARVEIIRRRIERATLRAPIDGVVVSGDLRKLVGGVVNQGDPLFQIAPTRKWTLQLEIPERVAADVMPGQIGEFSGFARPESERSFRLDRVWPAAEVRRGTNVFVAEADVEAAGEALRPGMEGVARLTIGPRPVRWIALHRVLNYLRLHVWL